MPYQKSLTHEQLFVDNKVDYKTLQKFLKREGRLSKSIYIELLKKAIHIFRTKNNNHRLLT
jgi:hypothetical protein